MCDRKGEKMKKENGFTLVELLAVIVILAVILVIAVPRITDVIENSKVGTITSSAKVILDAAEKKYAENQVIETTEEITCNKISNLNTEDYGSCNITFNGSVPSISLVGSGKLEGYKCEGTKDNLNCKKVESVNLTINLDGGVGNNQSGSYETGDIVTLNVPTKDGYVFSKWELVSGDSVLNGNSVTIGSKETTIKAIWRDLEFSVEIGYEETSTASLNNDNSNISLYLGEISIGKKIEAYLQVLGKTVSSFKLSVNIENTGVYMNGQEFIYDSASDTYTISEPKYFPTTLDKNYTVTLEYNGKTYEDTVYVESKTNSKPYKFILKLS